MPVDILPHQPTLGDLLAPRMAEGMTQGLQQAQALSQQRQQGSALANILGLPPEQQQQYGKLSPQLQMELAKEHFSGIKELQKLELAEKKSRQSEMIKSEWQSPEVKKYRESLGIREETAAQLAPALENARQYQNDPSRFIPGTAASKALGDLSTRAFAFYKPLFGGRLTQKEFTKSIQNLAGNRTTPAGFSQALNIIESMMQQAENEGNFFYEALEQGMTPTQARRETLKRSKETASQIVEILKGKPKEKKSLEDIFG